MLKLGLLSQEQEAILIAEFKRAAAIPQAELDKIIAQQKDEPTEYIEYLKATVAAFGIHAPRIIKGINGSLAKSMEEKIG